MHRDKTFLNIAQTLNRDKTFLNIAQTLSRTPRPYPQAVPQDLDT